MIEIVLPKVELKDRRARECYVCGGMMIAGLESGTYTFNDREYRIRRIRTWKCLECDEQGYDTEEVKRIEDALRKKVEEK